MSTKINARSPSQKSPLPKVGLTYALPTITTSFLIAPLAIVQGIYAKYFGLSLTTIASILLIARVFDAVTDPLIGFYSDRYHANTGTRKPFIIVGGLLLIVSSYFLYVPVDLETLKLLDLDVMQNSVSDSYFLGWFIIFYLSWTLFEIPHLAWGSELAATSKSKNLIYSLRSFGSWIGLLLFYSVPLLPFSKTNEFTPQSLSLAVLLVSCLMLPLLYFCVKLTPNGVEIPSSRVAPKDKYNALKLKHLIYEVFRNQPLMLFLSASILGSAAVSGMWFTLLFIYVDSYLQLGDKFAQASIISLFVGILMIAVWYRIANYLGKKYTLALGLSANAIGIILTGLLTQGEANFFSLLLVMVLCYGVGITAIDALAPSLLADIIDYSRWKSGVDQAATYFSLNSILVKTAVAVGGAIGLGIAGSYGFDPAAASHSADDVKGLVMAISWIPAGIVICAMALFLANPLNARRHALIRQRLDARDLRTARAIQRRSPSDLALVGTRLSKAHIHSES